MNATGFGARVRWEDGIAVVELTGEITSAAEGGLNDAYAEVAGEPKVLLDFSVVDYINSTGIAVIVGILAQARRNGQELQAGGLAEHYREIFRITRLSDFMTILDDGEGD
jgi:anti-sigma B factor antagonist